VSFLCVQVFRLVFLHLYYTRLCDFVCKHVLVDVCLLLYSCAFIRLCCYCVYIYIYICTRLFFCVLVFSHVFLCTLLLANLVVFIVCTRRILQICLNVYTLVFAQVCLYFVCNRVSAQCPYLSCAHVPLHKFVFCVYMCQHPFCAR
jgi:hypothetical protein